MLADAQVDVLSALKTNKPYFFKTCLTIRDKAGNFRPFVLNKAQVHLHNMIEELKRRRQYLRLVIVKGRQCGTSTYVGARFFHDAIFNTGLMVFILTHHTDSTSHLFNMVRDYYDFLPEALKLQLPLQRSNRKEIIFGHQKSSYHVGTAGSGAVGRGTTVHRFHGSEAAFWENTDEIATGVMTAIGEVPGTELILESTANGIGTYFHNVALSGLREESKYDTVFLPWYWMPEYSLPVPPGTGFTSKELEIQHLYKLSDEQLYWRRRKLDDDFEGREWKMNQEFPMTLHEAFVSSGTRLLEAERVHKARKNTFTDPTAPVVMGIDPAHEKDRTVFMIRQGRAIRYWKAYEGGTVDDPSIAGIAAELIEKYEVDQAFIDIGAGYGAFDCLCSLGYKSKVTKVHFGQKSILPDVFQNKSAEMADSVRKWFREQDVSIPDDDEFVADLLVIPDLIKTTGRGVLSLPSKEDIKQSLGGQSPDIFDALRLTFAFPVMSRKVQNMTRDFRNTIQKKINRNLSQHRKVLSKLGI